MGLQGAKRRVVKRCAGDNDSIVCRETDLAVETKLTASLVAWSPVFRNSKRMEEGF